MVGESTQIYHKIVFYAPIIRCSFEQSRKDLDFDHPGAESAP